MFEINLIKHRIQNLLKKRKILENMLHYNMKKSRLEQIHVELECPDIWKQPQYAKILGKERSQLEFVINTMNQYLYDINNIQDLLNLVESENETNLLYEINNEIHILEMKLNSMELKYIFSNQNDHMDCYIDIQSGSGGIEAQDWAKILLKMYLQWSESHKFQTKIIEESEGEITGIKSVTIKIIGHYAYGWLRTESGVHRLVRKSPFNSNGRRHTSFSSIFVYPAVDNKIDLNIHPADLRIDVYRSSGAGGQHVNRTESAVRITHLPTNIVTQCQNERSQHKNKDQAMKQLKSKLYLFELKKENMKKKELEYMKSDINWGHQIRSYILDDGRVKDLRTGIEIRDIQSVLNGNLDKFIKASLKLGL